MKKLFLSLVLLLFVVLGVGCKKDDEKTITVAASPSPHAEILEEARAYIESKGYKLVVKVYDDYIIPNVVVQEGEVFANYFQHIPYLNDYNEKNKSNLVPVLRVHCEPLGVYKGTKSSLEEIAEGDKIAVPNDSTNFSRALYLLEDLGLIEVDHSKGFLLSLNDIKSNPKNLDIIQFEAAAIPAQLSEVAYGVINGNYALSAGIKDNRLASEDPESESLKTYANVLVVKKGNENDPRTKVLIEALSQDNIRKFIEEKYQGVVVHSISIPE